MLVLALDTSTPTMTAGVVSVLRPHEMAEALQRGAGATPEPCRTLAEHSVTDAFGHAEHLMPLVTRALAEAGQELREVEAVVVGIGPGPFTGLRVGMATAAALGDALDVPVHGVPSHEAVVRSLDEAPAGDVLVVTDARRREVYLSGFSATGARRIDPTVLAPAAVPELLAEAGEFAPVGMAGAGVGLLTDTLDLPVLPHGGSASGLTASAAFAACVLPALLTGVVPGPLTPLYLRRPDAAEPHGPKAVLPQEDSYSVSQSSERR